MSNIFNVNLFRFYKHSLIGALFTALLTALLTVLPDMGVSSCTVTIVEHIEDVIAAFFSGF